MSMRATASHDMVIKDCWVPEQASSACVRPAIPTSARTSSSSWFCCSVASVYLGVATARA